MQIKSFETSTYKSAKSNSIATKQSNLISFSGISIKDRSHNSEDKFDKKSNSHMRSRLQDLIEYMQSRENYIEEADKIDKNINNKSLSFYLSIKELVRFSFDRSKKLDNHIDKLKTERSMQLNEKKEMVKKAQNEVESARSLANSTISEFYNNGKNNDVAKIRTIAPKSKVNASYDALRGYDRIAGYDYEKYVLDQFFIRDIQDEQIGENAKVYGSVLVFGPTGNGKTTLAKAFAEQTGCNLVPIRTFGSIGKDKNREFMDKLISEAEKAEEIFQESSVRTILFVDEITKSVNYNSPINKEFQQFLKDCSSKYHCTVFASSNNPLDLGLDDTVEAFPIRISVDPPDEENLLDILRHYIKGRTSCHINYGQLVDELVSRSEGKYSNAQIRQICDEVYANKGENSSQQDFIDEIRATVPAIDPEALDKFIGEKKSLLTDEL